MSALKKPVLDALTDAFLVCDIEGSAMSTPLDGENSRSQGNDISTASSSAAANAC
jgi:hypothetical protein